MFKALKIMKDNLRMEENEMDLQLIAPRNRRGADRGTAASHRQRYAYIKFLIEMRLGRLSSAANTLIDLAEAERNSPIARYASMVFDVDTMSRHSRNKVQPTEGSAAGSANYLYYMSKYLATMGDLPSAINLLRKLTDKIYMPMAYHYTNHLIDVYSATGL